ncbi:excinuclease ABC subunit A [Ruminobacter amylophilus]|uniref:UvrABC system protein A n=1 Tax=Ruminobacter amylophilus TaxID=867 RepID=A0A662ZL08_9GAMM|nr:excinuclease ABC subunit UvrA [Ruminobacter amylophilus]SFP67611.1 excinuclease ABC subunit A [Ruminobacter amylophilus]
MNNEIIIKGAKTHNLKNISLRIPKNRFCVITGLSGSGKSSLAFDTLYAEGQRKYVESLSSYARQFLQLMDKPDVEMIEGLSPAISIEQKSTSHNPRSTVGTITEVYDYLRLLFARIGEARCPEHGYVLKAQTVKQMIDSCLALPEDSKIMILSPVVRNRKGEYKVLLDNLARDGYIRVRIDNDTYDLSDPPTLDLQKKHTIEVVVDRLKIKTDESSRIRISDSLERALKLSDGLASVVSMTDDFPPLEFSSKYSCPECGYSVSEIEPRNFSFNNPAGACPCCLGLGIQEVFTPEAFIVDDKASIRDGAIKGWSASSTFNFATMDALSKQYGFSLDIPLNKLSSKILNIIFYGTGDKEIEVVQKFRNGSEFKSSKSFEGIVPQMTRKYQTARDYEKDEYTRFLTSVPCPECNGARLKKAYRNVFVNNINLPDLCNLTIAESLEFFNNLTLNPQQEQIASKVLKEIRERLSFLVNVGLSYLTLSRSAETLSGGEAQRIRLASQIGSGLTGVMYVLDEPSIGLHQRDNTKLLESLYHLRDLGNTVIVVEHDEDTIRRADHIIDIGPGAGEHGGSVVAEGTVEDIIKSKDSVTGKYLSGKCSIAIPKRKKSDKQYLVVKNATGHNLKGVDLKIPKGLFTCITGVSGSGKSTLINDTLYAIAQRRLNGAVNIKPAPYKSIDGLELFDKVINVDQTPIGRTPRSNCATYVDFFTTIRELFAQTQEARARGYTSGRFSFNIKGGRCEACQGDGIIKVEMNFLPDVYVTCDECNGKRYNKETLDITYKGKNISDILNMTVDEALEFFEAIPPLRKKLQTLADVGLAYIRLGQPATTLSGGEAQRIKLAKELSRKDTGRTLYILDEPTTGLHFQDVNMLLQVLFKLREQGNTIVVIEHNLDVIKSADHIIDLGPEGGEGGGQIIAEGTPEQVAKIKESYTGQFLAKILKK